MSLEITGSFVSKQEQQKGTSAKGEWVKQDFIVEIQEGQYPRKICLTAFGDNKIRLFDGINIGEQIKVSIDINSREFNGRWYTDIRGFKAMKEDPNMAPAPQAPAPSEFAPAPPADGGMPAPPPVDANDFGGGGTGDDLPF